MLHSEYIVGESISNVAQANTIAHIRTISKLLAYPSSLGVYYDFEFTMTFACAMVIVTVSIYHYYRSKILEKYKLSEGDMNF